MPKQKNIDTVASLSDKFQKAKSIVVTDYQGLTHKQAEDLHKSVKAQGGEFLVVKNSLLKIASGKIASTGPTAVLFAYEDELAPLKELSKFSKVTLIPKIKSSFFGDTEYDAAQTTTLAKLPGKLELQAQVVGRLSGPLYGLLYTLNGNLNKLVYVLSQIKPEVNN